MHNVSKKLPAPVIQDHPAYHVIGVKEQHSFVEGIITTIAGQWESFMTRIHEIGDRGTAALGVCFSIPGENPFDYITGAIVNNDASSTVPEGMCKVTLEPQTYAIFTHTGPVAGLTVTYQEIDQWLKENGKYKRAATPDFEYYDERFTGNDNMDSQFDIYIPVV
ncbi:MAG: hypothetical protein K0S39_5243 [Paenibacillus sp.]|jgi:AraC family transcriptional regulator|nr:hypothetical protein [Paenibacillus sp.]